MSISDAHHQQCIGKPCRVVEREAGVTMLTQELLKELLHYDPETGIFTWRVAPSRRVRAGSVAGTVTQRGYVSIRIDGTDYRAHRLAFLYVDGAFPPAAVDHVDHITNNNRFSNLRLATLSENQKNRRINRNNTSGWKGVSWDAHAGSWRVLAWMNGKQKYLGCYPTAEAGGAAYDAFARKHHGEFYHATRHHKAST